MMRDLSQRAAVAGVLVISAYVLFKLVLGAVTAVALTIVGVIALLAFLWALNRVL